MIWGFLTPYLHYWWELVCAIVYGTSNLLSFPLAYLFDSLPVFPSFFAEKESKLRNEITD